MSFSSAYTPLRLDSLTPFRDPDEEAQSWPGDPLLRIPRKPINNGYSKESTSSLLSRETTLPGVLRFSSIDWSSTLKIPRHCYPAWRFRDQSYVQEIPQKSPTRSLGFVELSSIYDYVICYSQSLWNHYRLRKTWYYRRSRQEALQHSLHSFEHDTRYKHCK